MWPSSFYVSTTWHDNNNKKNEKKKNDEKIVRIRRDEQVSHSRLSTGRFYLVCPYMEEPWFSCRGTLLYMDVTLKTANGNTHTVAHFIMLLTIQYGQETVSAPNFWLFREHQQPLYRITIKLASKNKFMRIRCTVLVPYCTWPDARVVVSDTINVIQIDNSSRLIYSR